jgi:hypothetical protein
MTIDKDLLPKWLSVACTISSFTIAHGNLHLAAPAMLHTIFVCSKIPPKFLFVLYICIMKLKNL